MEKKEVVVSEKPMDWLPSENVALKRTPDLDCGIYQDDDLVLPDIIRDEP
jgi:hypothetical protein